MGRVLPRLFALGAILVGTGFVIASAAGNHDAVGDSIPARHPAAASLRMARAGTATLVPAPDAVPSGTKVTIDVTSPALGGRRVPVVVYLPPGYSSDPHARYPVFYLLHGNPGSPKQFFTQGGIKLTYDVLLAQGKIKPMILVMPMGSPTFSFDEEWANTVQPHNDWETFVARDVVNAIDANYRTIATERGRAIGGLSSGGYGALNIDFHHVGEFGLVESWSGYYVADDSTDLFGHQASLIADNSPSVELPRVANELRATHTYIWMYDGTQEIYRGTKYFTAELAKLHIDYSWQLFPGKHLWTLWRPEMANSLTTASDYFQFGAPPLSQTPLDKSSR